MNKRRTGSVRSEAPGGDGVRRLGVVVVTGFLFCPGALATRADAQSGSWILPSSAYSGGANGAEFHSDVRILNLGTAPVTIAGTFYDQSNRETYAAGPFEVAARNQASFDNVLLSLFGRPLGSYGPIRFQSSGPIVVSSSVNNVNACGNGSTAGLWLPGIAASQALKAGALGQLALSASAGSGYRTNVVFMNPGEAGTAVRANLRRGDGSLVGTLTIDSIAANGFRQVELSSVPGAAGTTDANLWMEFRSDQPLLAYASVIHNASGDPFAIVATADSEGSGEEGNEVTVTLPGGVPLVMIRVPAGTFQMGSPVSERSRENGETLHQVTLTSDYYLGRYEVTQGQWKALMGTNPSANVACGDDCPVDSVSWANARGVGGFIEKLNAHIAATGQAGAGKYRLPTEAEWERAARGGGQTRFSFGDALDGDDYNCGLSAQAEPHMWWCANAGARMPQPVGGKQPNPYGLYDVHGNVWEWCEDWYGSYSPAPQTDPIGPATGASRTWRGGSSHYELRGCRSAMRFDYDPGGREDIGLRLARSK
ncbi:MAG: formylglycine-generating enzyme family protein [Holophagales bacterium]|nr:formylglycine-generating enzyme family protein [Holophagales bacterium]MBK9967188.1 formylglycine-generating enzyme family protein [Holophagales bacterium]